MKKYLALLLAVLMLTAMFAGCASKETTTDSPAASTETAEPAKTEETKTEEPAAEEAPASEEGKVFNIYAWNEEFKGFFEKYYTVPEGVTVNWIITPSADGAYQDIMGIDQSLFEAANIDGASSLQVFFKVTLPLLMPILVYTVITALIGGLQMFDVPQVLTNGLGTPNRSSTTLVMYLNNYLKTSKNYGMSGAISVVIFIITGLLSLVVFKSLTKQEENERGRLQ